MSQIIFYFIILVFVIPVKADDKVYFQACFNEKKLASSAYKEISFIQNKSDKIKTVGKCIDFYIDQTREGLYQKFLQVKFMGQYNLSSSETSQDERQCKLEIIETQKLLRNNLIIETSKNHLLSQSNRNKNLISTMNMYISHNMSGSMIIDNESIKIHCRVVKNGYNLKISANSDNFTLETSRYISKGSIIDLGDFIQDLDNKNKELSLSKGIKLNDSIGSKYSSIKIKAH